MTDVRTGRAGITLVATVCLAIVVLAQQPWYRLYQEAKEHIGRREYAAAERKLQAAKAGGPRPGASVLAYGNLRIAYVPDYYLGVVYLSTNRPKEAAAAFEAARAIAPSNSREFGQLGEQLKLAQQRAAPPTVVAGGTAVTPGSVPGGTTPAPPHTAPRANPPAANPTVQRERQFTTALNEAETLLGQRRYRDALTRAEQALALNVDNARANGLVARINTADAQAQQQQTLAASVKAVSDALADSDYIRAQAAVGVLARLAPSYSQLPDFRARVAVLRETRNAASAERAAMRAFFNNNYEQAIKLLRDSRERRPLSPRGYFYLACGQAALALREATVDQAQLVEARRVLNEGGAPAAALPDRRYVSPRILKELGPRP